MALKVVDPPKVRELYFWALQASFAGDNGVTGGAHLGLQWHPSYPGSTAVNWGGYDESGQELTGADSALPSVLGNANTRNFSWVEGAEYRLRIFSEQPGLWAGEVTDTANGAATVVRTLSGGGSYLTLPMVWSEVFAKCDAPGTMVVWSAPGGRTISGEEWRPDGYTTTYQRERDGGCSNTDSRTLGEGVGQLTTVARTNPHGTELIAQ